MSRSALPLAQRLAQGLASSPWRAPSGRCVEQCRINAPTRICRTCEGRMHAFQHLQDCLTQEYHRHAAHVFLGATGIAVRVLAPLLRHKGEDPPVLVLDPAGRFVISLICGHWGGGNALARHIARLVGAMPVITTASDSSTNNVTPLTLDLLLRDAGLRILDWDCLPKAQAALLEERTLPLWDPCYALPGAVPPAFERLTCDEDGPPPTDMARTSPVPVSAVHWRRMPKAENLLRIAVPRLYVGLGCRKNLPRNVAVTALEELFAANNLEPRAVAGLASVEEKREEPPLLFAAARLHAPLFAFAAATLAQCDTPHPSQAAGHRFGQKDFSVCEAAALLAAGQDSRLVVSKQTYKRCLTLSVALAAQNPQFSI
ncbi:MAG: cobalamin biosynthesis protein [Desulfovibrio sp.]|nr:cobalamin biosynthesis protein [Desulfovibrio sp.]